MKSTLRWLKNQVEKILGQEAKNKGKVERKGEAQLNDAVQMKYSTRSKSRERKNMDRFLRFKKFNWCRMKKEEREYVSDWHEVTPGY